MARSPASDFVCATTTLLLSTPYSLHPTPYSLYSGVGGGDGFVEALGEGVGIVRGQAGGGDGVAYDD